MRRASRTPGKMAAENTTCGQCLHPVPHERNSSSFSPFSCSFAQLLTEGRRLPSRMAGDPPLPLPQRQQPGRQRRRTRASRVLPPATPLLPAFARSVSSDASSGGCSVVSSGTRRMRKQQSSDGEKQEQGARRFRIKAERKGRGVGARCCTSALKMTRREKR